MNYIKRINNFLLLTRCLIGLLSWGRADKVSQKISRIIVVPAGKLGDVVCNTPILVTIRTHLPSAHIIIAGATKLHRPLLADSGLVDEYLDFEEGNVIKHIKDCQAQVAIVTGPSFESTAFFYLARVPLIIAPVVLGGFSPTETKLYKILQRFIKTFPYKIDEYAPRERLRALEPLGIFTDDTKKQLGFSELANQKIEKFFTTNNVDLGKDLVIGISPTAGNKIKEWPVERFSRVADYLSEKHHAKVLIVGSKDDSDKVQEMITYLNKKTKIINTSGLFNFDELKAFISKLNLFISVDTGPIYIAEAFSVPTVNIVGPVDEKVQPPQGFIHRNVVPLRKGMGAELTVLNARRYNKREALRQVISITVADVVSVMDKLIYDIKNTYPML